MANRSSLSDVQAALSGSNPKAPGFAGGYLLIIPGKANSIQGTLWHKYHLYV
jgi:hypothetical protein